MQVIERIFFGNYILSVALISWLSAQVLKTLLTFIKQKKLNVHVFCAAAPTEVQGLPPSLLAADGNGCARSVSA